jgi:hypothetical protein
LDRWDQPIREILNDLLTISQRATTAKTNQFQKSKQFLSKLFSKKLHLHLLVISALQKTTHYQQQKGKMETPGPWVSIHAMAHVQAADKYDSTNQGYSRGS